MNTSGFTVLYVPIGVGTFHMESARAQFASSAACLRTLAEDVVCPDDILLTTQELSAWLDRPEPDLIILQNITFANSAYAAEVLRRFDAPLVLWALREPVIDGGRLRLNSLTGAYAAANAAASYRDNPVEFVYGSPEEPDVREALSTFIDAAAMKRDLKSLKISAIGQTPQGFGFGRALDAELQRVFGVTLEAIESRELIRDAKALLITDCETEWAEAFGTLSGLSKTPVKNRDDFVRLYRAYKNYIEANGIGAVASRCWPDFFTDYGTPVCGVLSLLNANGITASCETDVYGALSMYIGSGFTGEPAFFGDPASLDEAENTITFWHCGMAACSLAREAEGAQVGVHPNRRIGPVMNFGCRASERAVIFRVGRRADASFRFFIAEGEILDRPRQFEGTSIVVKTDAPAGQIVEEGIKGGWEPHYAVVYGDAASRLEALGHMLGVDVYRY